MARVADRNGSLQRAMGGKEERGDTLRGLISHVNVI